MTLPKRFLCCILLFLSCATQAQQDSFTILFLGDSLTAGYGLDEAQSFPSLVESKLRDDGYTNLEIINGGVSGSTSASAVNRLQWYLRADPDLMLLALGANDGLRGLSIEQMEENLRQAIELALDNDVRVALAGMLIPPNYGEEYTGAFKAVYPRLAEEYDLPFLPFLLQDVAAVPELNQADGIHPNAEGTEIVAEHVYRFLKPLLPPPS